MANNNGGDVVGILVILWLAASGVGILIGIVLGVAGTAR